MSEPKTKRKRRSYSCGPCKLLKIKCDLQVPVCSSCVKFKRHDKCLMDPAHPPSREELTKIQERKKRTIIKKLRQSSGASASAPGSLPVFDPNVVGDKGNVFRRLAPLAPPLSLGRVPSSSIPPPIHSLPAPTNIAPPPPPPPANLTDASSAPPSASPAAPSLSLPAPTTGATPMPSAPPPPPPPHSEADASAPSAPSATTTIDMSITELKKVKRLLPRSWHLVEGLVALFYRACHPLVAQVMPPARVLGDLHRAYHKLTEMSPSLLDRPVSYLANVMQSVSLTDGDIRGLSLLLSMMSTGLMFAKLSSMPELSAISSHLFDAISFKPHGDIIDDWMSMSRQLYQRSVRYASLDDITFLIEWYLVVSTFCDHHLDIVKHYLEFNTVLMYGALNRDFIAAISDNEHIGDANSPVVNRINHYWIQLKLCEIDCSFFVDKGSLLQGAQYAHGNIPSFEFMERLYGGAGFPELPVDEVKTSLFVWGKYYSRKLEIRDLHEFIVSYLSLYADMAQFTQEAVASWPQDAAAQWTAAVRASSAYFLCVRWLTFVRLEQGYFPSLRFAIYTMAMVCQFNPVLRLMDEHPDFLAHSLPEANVHHFRWVYVLFIYSSVFLAVLASFRQRTGALSPSRVYDTVRAKFDRVWRQFHSLEALRSVPKYADCLEISQLWAQLGALASSRDLIAALQRALGADRSSRAVNYFFGSEHNLGAYVDTLWELMDDMCRATEPLTVVRGIVVNDDMLETYGSRLEGFQFDKDDVIEFIDAHSTT
ncbi:hypothetical protein DIRU0_B00782 [Diutina rugosa]